MFYSPMLRSPPTKKCALVALPADHALVPDPGALALQNALGHGGGGAALFRVQVKLAHDGRRVVGAGIAPLQQPVHGFADAGGERVVVFF